RVRKTGNGSPGCPGIAARRRLGAPWNSPGTAHSPRTAHRPRLRAGADGPRPPRRGERDEARAEEEARPGLGDDRDPGLVVARRIDAPADHRRSVVGDADRVAKLPPGGVGAVRREDFRERTPEVSGDN